MLIQLFMEQISLAYYNWRANMAARPIRPAAGASRALILGVKLRNVAPESAPDAAAMPGLNHHWRNQCRTAC